MGISRKDILTAVSEVALILAWIFQRIIQKTFTDFLFTYFHVPETSVIGFLSAHFMDVFVPITAVMVAIKIGISIGQIKKGVAKTGQHLTIAVNGGDEFEKVEHRSGGLLYKVFAAVKNEGNSIVPNCKFFVRLFRNGDPEGTKYIIENTFESHPFTDPRFILVATCSQPFPSNVQMGPNRVTLNRPPHGLANSNDFLSVNEKYLVVLSVESHDKEISKITCNLIVENEKLRLVKIK